MKGTKYIAYYRATSKRQAESGVSLEGQRAAVALYIGAESDRLLVAGFTEIERGQRKDRPALAEALVECRTRKATLIIAKFDRLSCDERFISTLIESGVNFVACGFPEAERFMFRMLPAAEDEAKMVSARTKLAIAAVKAREAKLGAGSGNLREHGDKGRALSVAVRQRKVQQRNEVLGPFVKHLRDRGMTLEAITQLLNEDGSYESPRGRGWHPTGVLRLLRWMETKSKTSDNEQCDPPPES